MVKRLLSTIICLTFSIFSWAQLSEGLVGQYYFNDGDYNDLSGNNYNPDYNSASPTEDRFGNSGYAYSFDGSQHINIPHRTEFASENMTVSVWYKSSSESFGRIIALPFSASQTFSVNYRAPLSTPEGVDFYANYDIPEDWTPVWTGIDVSADDQWHHVIGIRDALLKRMYIYVDCRLTDSIDYSGDMYLPNEDLAIGRFSESFGQYFEGSIDDIRIYNRVLNSSEIDSLCYEDNPLLSINEVISKNSVRISCYPNPANDQLNLLTDSSVKSYRILSISGSVVQSNELLTDKIDITRLSSGPYIIEIQTLEGDYLNALFTKK